MNPNPLFPPGPAGTQGFGSHTHNHTLSDQALEALRVRYARGEVDRTEYLERRADLGGQAIPDAPDPTETLADQE